MATIPKPSIDPTQANAGDSQASNPIQYKRCKECLANLPHSAYSFFKYGRYGIRHTCKECRNQANRLYRIEKYDAKPRIDYDDSFIRSVKRSNELLLKPILGQSTMVELAGLDVVKGIVYKIFVGKSPDTSMNVLTIFDLAGTSFLEVQFMGGKDAFETVIGNLQMKNIRLCPSVGDAEVIKKVIYFLT